MSPATLNQCKKFGAKRSMRGHNRVVDFSNVGGLSHHIELLREIIIFPLIYSDLYARFNINAPRGVLFYGPPGTGKTLVAGALVTEMNRKFIGKVSFYQRKGADILNKWVGESERKLRELFEKAAQTSPSVIFFDELDGLAPERSQRNDQIHCSIVATLLALMDGLDTMPGVVVIGATNRIDAVDPALRRSGRFDKELYFPLPPTAARKEILQVHLRSWQHNISSDFLSYLAEITAGFCGSDLNALCTETILCCAKRIYPEVQKQEKFKKIKIDFSTFKVEERDFLSAKINMVPSSQKQGSKMRRLNRCIQHLLSRQLDHILTSLQTLWPHFIQPSNKFLTEHGRYVGRLLLVGSNLQGVNSHLIPAILHALEHLPAHVLDIPSLFDKNLNNARRNLPSILVLSRVDEWWDLIDDTTQIGLIAGLEDIHAGLPLLLIATCNAELPPMLENYFYNNSSLVINVENPTVQEREQFFAPLFFGENEFSLVKILQKKKDNILVRSIKREKENVIENLQKQRLNDHQMATAQSDRKDVGHANSIRPLKRTIHITEDFEKIPQKKRKYSKTVPSSNKLLKQSYKCNTDNYIVPSETDERNTVSNKQEDTPSNSEISIDKINNDRHVNLQKQTFTTPLSCLLSYYKGLGVSKNSCTNYMKLESEENKKFCHFNGDSTDADEVTIFRLWKRTAHVTSKNLPVAQLELLYDTIVAGITINRDNFDSLTERLQKILENFETSY